MSGQHHPNDGVTPITVSPAHCTPGTLRQILSDTPFFNPLEASEVDAIAESFRHYHYDPGVPIQHAGEPAERLSIVAAGMVRLVRPTSEGQDVLLDILHPGEFFGSLPMLGDDSYQETAIAHTNCCILHTTSGRFRDLLERYPAAALATLTFVANRLRRAQEAIEGLSAHPVEQRIARVLLTLADRAGRQRASDVLIDMPLSRQDLADMTGATVETASRIVSDLRRGGVLATGRGWIAVADFPALEQLAEGRVKE